MMDKAYQERFTSALLGVMMQTSMTETNGQRTAYIPAAEIIDTFTTMMALLLRDSEVTSTPSRTRDACDQLARRLQKRINAAKQQESPFQTMTLGPLN